MYNSNPFTSFNYDTYIPDMEPEKTKIESFDDNKYENINGQKSLNNLKLSKNKRYIQRLEKFENNGYESDDVESNVTEYEPDDQSVYQRKYLNYLINNNNNHNNKHNNTRKISFFANESLDQYLYLFLIIILFFITMLQKNRIDHLNDLLAFKLANFSINSQPMTTNGL